ncbi:MAG: nuclear transport factor 2 family protein [Phycisphaerales bacterium]
MPSANVQVVQRLYDAFAAGDLPGALACMSPDIEWRQAEGNPWADGNPYIGPDAVAQGIFARCVHEFDGFTVHVGEIIDAGDTVIMLGRYTGTSKITGQSLDAPVAHVMRLKGGKISHYQQYADTRQLARVMGADS